MSGPSWWREESDTLALELGDERPVPEYAQQKLLLLVLQASRGGGDSDRGQASLGRKGRRP